MRRIPILATAIVAVGVAIMIAMGVWQIRRAEWKEQLLARYQAAEGASVLDGLPDPASIDRLAFRRGRISCAVATAITQIGGSNRSGEPGFRNIVGCRLDDGRTMMVDLGWNGPMARPAAPPIGQRVDAIGRLIPNEVLAKRALATIPRAVPLLLVSDRPMQGLQPSVAPSIADIPNNHRAYAVQWFLFAGVAVIIFLLAARRRAARR